jgi:hypothetical protein
MENLINSGKLLLEENNFAKPRMKIWQIQCERTLVSLYDHEIAKEFGQTLSGGAVIRHGMNLYAEVYKPRIKNAVIFLESLLTTDLPQAVASVPSANSSPQTMTISGGTVIFGDNATVNNITVKEVLSALQKEIENKSPEGESKNKALDAVKNITSNETIANIVGQTLGAFLSHTIK